MGPPRKIDPISPRTINHLAQSGVPEKVFKMLLSFQFLHVGYVRSF